MKKSLDVFERWSFGVALRKQIDLEDTVIWAKTPTPEAKVPPPLPKSVASRPLFGRILGSILP